MPIDTVASADQKRTIYDWENTYKDKYDDYLRIDFRISYKLNAEKYNLVLAFDY